MSQISGSARVLANQKHFDSVAPNYDIMNALREKVMHQIVDEILDAYDFDEDSTVLLDFACAYVSSLCTPSILSPFEHFLVCRTGKKRSDSYL